MRLVCVLLVAVVMTVSVWAAEGDAVVGDGSTDIPPGMREAFARVRTIRLSHTVDLPAGARLDIGSDQLGGLLQDLGYVVVEGDGPADAEARLTIVGKAQSARYRSNPLVPGLDAWSGAQVWIALLLRCGGMEMTRSSSGSIPTPPSIRAGSYPTPADAPFAKALGEASPALVLLESILGVAASDELVHEWTRSGAPASLLMQCFNRSSRGSALREVVVSELRLRLPQADRVGIALLGELGDTRVVEPLRHGIGGGSDALRQTYAFALLRLGRRLPDVDLWGPDVAVAAGMVWVPPGEFMMGSEDGEDNEKPVHRACITKGFWIGKHEVTNAQYRRFCDATGRTFPSASDRGDDHPVVSVSWHDAKAYCDHYGLSLPTEAQWEYAARGRDALKYPWGNDWGWNERKCCYTMYRGSGGRTFPVGSFPEGASWCGALDMAGNAREWCADWSGRYTADPVNDPTGPGTGLYRLLRGGAWDSIDLWCRSATRSDYAPGGKNVDIGFRAARTP